MSDCFACFAASSKGEAKETSRKEQQQQQQQSGVPVPGSRRKRPASSKAPVVPPKGVPQANRPSPPQTPPQKSSPEPHPEPHPEPPKHALTNGFHAEPEIASLAESWFACSFLCMYSLVFSRKDIIGLQDRDGSILSGLRRPRGRSRTAR